MKGLAHQLEDTQQRLDTYVATPFPPPTPTAAEFMPFCSMFSLRPSPTPTRGLPYSPSCL